MRRSVSQTVGLVFAFLLGAAIFALLIWRTGVGTIVDSLQTFGILPFLGFVCISLLNFTLYSLRWQIIINETVAPEKRLPFHRVFLHRMSGYAAGYLTPGSQIAGEPIRVAMLHTDKIPIKEATSTVVLDLAFEIASFVLFVASGITLSVIAGVGRDSLAFEGSIVFLALVVVFILCFFFSTVTGRGFFSGMFRALHLQKRERFAPAYKWTCEMEELMHKFFRRRKAALLGVIALSLIVVSFKAFEAWYLGAFFDVSLTLRDAFLLSTLPGVALLLPIPAGLGVYEGSNAATFAILGLPLNAVAYTAVIRLRDAIFIGLGIMHATRQGEKLFGEKKV